MKWQEVNLDAAAQARIAEAAIFEKRLRLEAFLDISTQIGPFKLRALTLRDYLRLEYTENRLLIGGEPDAGDYLTFLWDLRTADEKRRIKRFTAWALRHLNEWTQTELQCYLAAQLNDMPRGGEPSKPTEGAGDSTVHGIFVVDLIASEYGWPEPQILDCPLSRSLQYAQSILKRKLGEKYAVTNPILGHARAKEMNRSKEEVPNG